jgi:hypothetical protein
MHAFSSIVDRRSTIFHRVWVALVVTPFNFE